MSGRNREGADTAIAVIPARGGSKRVPHKNIKAFCGRPVIEYAIRTCIEASLFEAVIVSTDSDEIAGVAEAAGAKAPFRRPAELSDDHTSTAAVFEHALRSVDPGGAHSLACCIYPATPFLLAEQLKEGLKLVRQDDVDCAFAACAYDAPIERAFAPADNGRLVMKWPEYKTTRTNDLSEHLHDAGQFYWVRTDAFLKAADFFSLRCKAVRLPRWRAHDIDTMEDWTRAELVFRSLLAGEGKR